MFKIHPINPLLFFCPKFRIQNQGNTFNYNNFNFFSNAYSRSTFSPNSPSPDTAMSVLLEPLSSLRHGQLAAKTASSYDAPLSEVVGHVLLQCCSHQVLDLDGRRQAPPYADEAFILCMQKPKWLRTEWQIVSCFFFFACG